MLRKRAFDSGTFSYLEADRTDVIMILRKEGLFDGIQQFYIRRSPDHIST